jgi:hypothetical protein
VRHCEIFSARENRAGGTVAAGRRLSRLRCAQSGKIDFRLRNVVDEICQHILSGEADYLDDFRLTVPCRLHPCYIVIAYMTASLGDVGGEPDSRGRLGVGRGAFAIERSILGSEFGQIGADIGVRREAVIATVDLGDCNGDALARFCIKRFGICFMERQEAAKRAGTKRTNTKKVWPAVAAGKLKIVLGGFEPDPLPINVVHLGQDLLAAKTRAFLDFLSLRLRQRANKTNLLAR